MLKGIGWALGIGVCSCGLFACHDQGVDEITCCDSGTAFGSTTTSTFVGGVASDAVSSNGTSGGTGGEATATPTTAAGGSGDGGAAGAPDPNEGGAAGEAPNSTGGGSGGGSDASGSGGFGGEPAPRLVATSVATSPPYWGPDNPSVDEVEQYVGNACIHHDEQRTNFEGFRFGAVMLGEDIENCGDFMCLVNRFQGRVSCPYGQTAADIALYDGDDPARCRTPSGEAVTLAVDPQLENRPREGAVTCTCRCDGDDPNASYCTCPSGTECNAVFGPPVVPGSPGEGSYCIPIGMGLTWEAYYGDECDPRTASCGNGGVNP